MSDHHWKEAIERWRRLTPDQRLRRHLEAIPRHVANSMAMEGEPVDEAWIRERLDRRIRRLGILKPPPVSRPTGNSHPNDGR